MSAARGAPSPPRKVTLIVDGIATEAVAGQSVAAALLGRRVANPWQVRTSVTGEPRGPLCGMGICYECRATVDGRALQRTCQMTVRDGMRVDTGVGTASSAPSPAPSPANAPEAIEVLVVGGGPAGIAAATAAAEAGCGVLLIDDNPAPGGQIWRGGGGAAAARARTRLGESGAAVASATSVVAVEPGRLVAVIGPQGIRRIAARRIVVATGARERFIPFPGWTLPGVVGAGGLQALIKQGFDVSGRRVVVAGTGPLLLAVGDLVVHSGGRLLAIAEQAGRVRLATFAAGLAAEPAKLLQALPLLATTGARTRPGTFPVAVTATTDGLRVTLRSGAAERTRDAVITCDILACGFGLVPDTTVARALGCAVGATGVVVDLLQRSTADGVFAAGECTGVGGVDKSLVEGRIAGLAAAERVAEAAALAGAAHRGRQFARRLEAAFALDPRLRFVARPDTIVCRCEDVVAGRLEGSGNWREAKLLTRLGMGPCQGRVCGTAADVVRGLSPDDVRPPLVPVPTGACVVDRPSD